MFAGGIELVGMIFGFTQIGHFDWASELSASLGRGLLVVGIIIRWSAIYTLGKYFTGTVMIKDDHRLVQNGLYRYLRHPAYAGALLAHLGLGLSFSKLDQSRLQCAAIYFCCFVSYPRGGESSCRGVW